MRVLVTGAAGFIGYHLTLRLLKEGHQVVGLDNLNDYYDVRLKEDRLARLVTMPAFRFVRGDLADDVLIDNLFVQEGFSHVVHLAAQAGVRYSLKKPRSYVQSNMVGFHNILEGCREAQVRHLVYASSSSVYGLNSARPYSEHHPVDHPVSLYAASKKANELMAHSYSYLYGLPCTGLRFFTVYGPWGRPDMALHIFTRAILEGRPIDVFNNGHLRRDFTYIDDIVEGIVRILVSPPLPDTDWDAAHPDPATSSAPWRIYNIGNNTTVELQEFIDLIEKALDKKAERNYLPMQPGDVQSTHADVHELAQITGFSPSTPLHKGIAQYVQWHRKYYRI